MSFYLTPSAFSLEHVLRSPSMNPLLGHPLGTLAMSNLLSRSVWLHYAWCIVYLYLLVYGWLCTLYDGLSWLHEWPSLVMRDLDLVAWVCAQGDYRRCIFMLYCMHDHRGLIVLIHVTQWHWFPRVYDMHQHACCFKWLQLVSIWACQYTPYTQTWNPVDVP